ncbi:hypothetical protein FisN_2Lh507 [Fistulifera solaris]|uniref:Calmodulin n=1 Tax=Fistulifera solaris TaxID=1519565 RepID=A0A1Z5JAG2_FISSO|nr:hypothetical protein FisN_2Lh507 [Fistulifera solaris]|eukprot:GAX10977.1 hypothetical protein FisN_2Lh507 [Fistulifera solaris]
MGCGPSKEAAAAVLVETSKATTTPRSINSKNITAASTQADSLRKGFSNRELKPLSDHSKKSAEERRNDWKVRPGYSSGASSYDGSEIGEDISTRDLNRSGILDLVNLRQEMQEKGGIATNVVRIETPFGKPIEEIYDGVHDGPVLGSGVSGIVRLVTHRETGVNYAVKCLDIGLVDSIEGLRQLRNEIFIMCQLDHPNIVRIEEVYESTNEIYILQELCHGGDLFDRLDEQPDFHYTEAQCARLVKQMVSAVRYLHSKGIIHRDLKLENFLFSNQEPDSELKMIDFGLSKHFELGQSLHDKVGTPYTVAPEIIQGAYDEKCDVWAVGVITYLLLSGETPFGGLDGESLLLVKENIMRGELTFEPTDVWAQVSEDGKGFVKRLLRADPKKRPTAREIQKDRWIQVWAKKDIREGNKLNSKTLESLVSFKENSDMQKILSEVLSFTLLPDQIADLRQEFELIDSDGDGEITLKALRTVLLENAEAGTLGALTEQEIVDIFDAIKTRKNEPTIRWHDFLAAGLSQARVDDRNLRLAFDRLDGNRRGYISIEDLQNLLGSSTAYEELEKIWRDSLKQCTSKDTIDFETFKKLMKGQPKEAGTPESSFRRAGKIVGEGSLGVLPEGESTEDHTSDSINESNKGDKPVRFQKKKSLSHELKSGVEWDDGDRSASIAFLPSKTDEDESSEFSLTSASPLMANRALYRRHRGMRLAVLEASKEFDKKRTDRQTKDIPVQAGLIMKRGTMPPVELEDAHTRALFDAAAKRCGRSRRTKNKTVSDVTGMLMKKPSPTLK